jgi:hypothetical protein
MGKKNFCRTTLFPYQISDEGEIVRVDWLLELELLLPPIEAVGMGERAGSDLGATEEESGEPAQGAIAILRPHLPFSLVPRTWLDEFRMPVVGNEGMVRAVEANQIFHATLTVVRFRFLEDPKHPVAEEERTFSTVAVVPGEGTPEGVWDFFHLGSDFLRDYGIRLDIDYGRLRTPPWESAEARVWSIDPTVPCGRLMYLPQGSPD